MKIKTLIIGLGDIGLKYDYDLPKKIIMTHTRAINSHPSFELVGAVDNSKERRKEFTEKYDKPAFCKLEHAVNFVDPSLMIIATPSSSHADIFNEIIHHATPTAILCEKPLDNDISNAFHIVRKSSSLGIRLFVNYMRRSDPGSLKVRDMIHSGSMGNYFKGIVWYSKGVFNNGSHFLNLLEYWFGECKSLKLLKKGPKYANGDQDFDFIVNFNCAEFHFISSPEKTNSYTSIEAFSTDGRLLYDRGGNLISWQEISAHELFANRSQVAEKKMWIQKSMKKYQYHVYCELAKALKGEKYSLCHGVDALRTIEKLENLFKG